ncbi:MAG: HAMP domain-containing histidine kinase [Nitrosopumilus sp.]|nr:HAMP domain-containing histidine kinase [Nitrosopumilus sp.]MDF2424025.1 HAMP domain-containing histidine kinase [Nitrosopumilus sp.]MDF2427368.1 HAMP domain-containing histidine kinase [Nitrosopumilus sp.]MDF2428573.1 HAMP domain-containing histidine kinase [Nitrosopumilus sp.]MDF2430045.1 HAMP domain-containing histidine kinase [Nitrosopumilus sp.]
MANSTINAKLNEVLHIQKNKCTCCQNNFTSSVKPILFKNSDDTEDKLIALCDLCVNGVHNLDPNFKVISNLKQELELQIQLSKKKQNDLDRNKLELLGMFSHEFKTPLVPIVGFSKILLNNDKLGPLTEKQKSAVKAIFSNAKVLSKRIEDLLDIRKIEENHMLFNYSEFDVSSLVLSTLKNFTRDWFCENVEIINLVPEKIILKSDEYKIRQILENLILNAVDFVPEENGKIEIGAQDKGDSVYFYVKDNGIGIPKDKQELIFEKFYQDDISHKRKRSGLGLGLSLCKKLSESLGGKIWAENNVDKGATFYFTILRQS